MRFLDDLYNRRKKLADVLADEEYSGIRQIVEDLYPDRAHFIYELLQNAEDVGAGEAKFMLEADRLVFEHNGRPFDDKDVEGITNIGKGTKADQEDKIGRFGIGFKAVFAYSETPHIWSPTYSFKITDLVLPSEIRGNTRLGQKTRFEFPFDNPKKSPEDSYEEIRIGLDELAETTLLFLSNLESIGWQIGHQASGEVLRIEHSKHHIEILKQTDGGADPSAHFLRFLDPVEGLEKQHVAIAFELNFLPNITDFDAHVSLSKQFQIVAANLGRVAVSFPAEKETSGLRFHIHAPFVPELSRASIKETPANIPLFEQLAQLATSSLPAIRDLKLLTGDFLGVLPNPQDTIPQRYKHFRDAIINEMNSKSLTPTYEKSHAPAKQLLQAKASLKTLLSENDLEFLIECDDEPRQWAIGASQKNSLQDRFLSSLAITEWDVEAFVELLEEKASTGTRWLRDESRMGQGPDDEFMAWLAGKPVEWHQQMYALLYDDFIVGPEYRRKQFIERLKPLRIVRLSNGNYSVGSKCFFPSDGVESDEVLPRVPKDIYSSGKSKTQQENARRFLEAIGVREVGEAEQVAALLKQRYSPEAVKREEFKPDRRDIERFIALVEKEPASAKVFAHHYIFELADGKWGKPGQVYLDSPFIDTGLSAYYETFGKEAQRTALAKSYEDCGTDITKLADFCKAVGVIYELPIIKTNCHSNPQWEYLSGDPGGYGYSSDVDFAVEDLDKLLESPTTQLSRLVWQTMNGSDKKYLEAAYKKSDKGGFRYADSQFVHVLKKRAWVPQKNGEFVRPCDAAREELPKGFPFDEGMEWIGKVNFGENAIKHSEEYKRRNQQASELGVYLEDIELMKQYREEFEQWKAGLVKREKPAFPTKISTNPERRQERLAEQMNESPEKEYEPRNRSVRTTKGTIDPILWLRNQYTNVAGQMICQICKEEMPFRKRDGEYYFEAVEALSKDHFAKEHEAQFLAMCPLCAAMYNEFVKHDEEAMESLKNALMNSEDAKVSLQLGDLDTSVRFVDIHFRDIKTIIEAQE